MSKRIGRPPSCECGECSKCRTRIKARERYQSLPPDERREIVARRDKERVRAYDRERYKRPENIARLTRSTKAWRQRNPEKASAHNKVARALRSGALVKQPCEVCGEKNVHAHHDDYSKPLVVRWLCPLHHAAQR